jgi:hypothetical protein
MGHRTNLKYFPFPDATLRWGRNIGKTESFIWISSSCRPRVARSRIRQCEETPIDQRVMDKSFHHGHNTVFVGSQYLHDILTSGSEVPLNSTDLHCFYKHSSKPEWNLHDKNKKVRITHNSNLSSITDIVRQIMSLCILLRVYIETALPSQETFLDSWRPQNNHQSQYEESSHCMSQLEVQNTKLVILVSMSVINSCLKIVQSKN